MDNGTMKTRTFTLVAGVAWLVAVGSGVGSSSYDDWKPWYAVFAVALCVGAAFTVVAAAWATRGPSRPRLRTAGLVLGGLGTFMALVGAWAYPLWMTLLGVGLAMIAVASIPEQRRGVSLLAGAQLVGMAVGFAGIIAKIGWQDEYGDYPLAGSIGLVVTGVLTVVGLVVLTQSIEGQRERPLESVSAA